MITIDFKDRRPLYQQIMEKIEALATQGLLAEDEQLPSVRSLAIELSINPNTIQRAYSELERKGITYSVSGKGSFLAKDSTSLKEDQQLLLWQSLEKLIRLSLQLNVGQQVFIEKTNHLFLQLGGVGK